MISDIMGRQFVCSSFSWEVLNSTEFNNTDESRAALQADSSYSGLE